MTVTWAKLAKKFRHLVVRYLPAEITGTTAAFIAALVGNHLSGSLVVTAICGTIGENVGYYGYFVVKEIRENYGRHSKLPKLLRAWRTAVHTMRNLVVEFGPAEVLDSWLVRPFCLYASTSLSGNLAVGLLVGKLAADLVFYLFAAIGYEVRNRYLQNSPSPDAE